MKALLLLLFGAIAGCAGDVMRTVYCKNLCSDYLGIPENSMPLCAAEHLKMHECGTVITCDWAEAERDKVRPVANSSDILCCYKTTIKEKGDCGEALVSHPDPVEQQAVNIHSVSDQCPYQLAPWLLCILLLFIIAFQAAYIVKLSICVAGHQKITQGDDTVYPQSVISHPLVNTQLLGSTSE